MKHKKRTVKPKHGGTDQPMTIDELNDGPVNDDPIVEDNYDDSIVEDMSQPDGGPMMIEELNVEDDTEGQTDSEMDGGRKKNKTRKRAKQTMGTKKKKKTKKIKKKNKKNKKTRKTRKKMKGGNQMFGRGYGANCNDPNFSIKNTNLLKLFPYKPT
uniref:Uncharacterized protein n=1 Tax=viral metagenome TaxID=1070528 RepID=A0A6C0LPB4_9ZZZZ